MSSELDSPLRSYVLSHPVCGSFHTLLPSRPLLSLSVVVIVLLYRRGRHHLITSRGASPYSGTFALLLALFSVNAFVGCLPGFLPEIGDIVVDDAIVGSSRTGAQSRIRLSAAPMATIKQCARLAGAHHCHFALTLVGGILVPASPFHSPGVTGTILQTVRHTLRESPPDLGRVSNFTDRLFNRL